MQSKGGNGVNMPDEFRIGKLPDIPRSPRGHSAEPLDEALVAKIEAGIPKGTETQNAIVGSTLYSATVAELTAYNVDNEHPLDNLVKLAKRFAFNGSSVMRKHAAVVATKRKLTVGCRCINEGTDDRPMVRWYVVLTTPKPRTANPE
jgi:hypothetical protein